MKKWLGSRDGRTAVPLDDLLAGSVDEEEPAERPRLHLQAELSRVQSVHVRGLSISESLNGLSWAALAELVGPPTDGTSSPIRPDGTTVFQRPAQPAGHRRGLSASLSARGLPSPSRLLQGHRFTSAGRAFKDMIHSLRTPSESEAAHGPPGEAGASRHHEATNNAYETRRAGEAARLSSPASIGGGGGGGGGARRHTIGDAAAAAHAVLRSLRPHSRLGDVRASADGNETPRRRLAAVQEQGGVHSTPPRVPAEQAPQPTTPGPAAGLAVSIPELTSSPTGSINSPGRLLPRPTATTTPVLQRSMKSAFGSVMPRLFGRHTPDPGYSPRAADADASGAQRIITPTVSSAAPRAAEPVPSSPSAAPSEAQAEAGQTQSPLRGAARKRSAAPPPPAPSQLQQTQETAGEQPAAAGGSAFGAAGDAPPGLAAAMHAMAGLKSQRPDDPTSTPSEPAPSPAHGDAQVPASIQQSSAEPEDQSTSDCSVADARRTAAAIGQNVVAEKDAPSAHENARRLSDGAGQLEPGGRTKPAGLAQLSAPAPPASAAAGPSAGGPGGPQPRPISALAHMLPSSQPETAQHVALEQQVPGDAAATPLPPLPPLPPAPAPAARPLPPLTPFQLSFLQQQTSARNEAGREDAPLGGAPLLGSTSSLPPRAATEGTTDSAASSSRASALAQHASSYLAAMATAATSAAEELAVELAKEQGALSSGRSTSLVLRAAPVVVAEASGGVHGQVGQVSVRPIISPVEQASCELQSNGSSSSGSDSGLDDLPTSRGESSGALIVGPHSSVGAPGLPALANGGPALGAVSELTPPATPGTANRDATPTRDGGSGVLEPCYWSIPHKDITLVRRLGSGSYGEVWLASYRFVDVAVKLIPWRWNRRGQDGGASGTGGASPGPAGTRLLPGSPRRSPDDVLADFRQEVDFQRRLSLHPSIVPFIGACEPQEASGDGGAGDGNGHAPSNSGVGPAPGGSPPNSQLAIVMGYCRLGDLFSMIRKARSVARMMAANKRPEDCGPSLAHALVFYSNWERRLDVAACAAAGLYHMHQAGVVHRDLTSYNLLLDAGFAAKVCDFNLSRVVPGSSSPIFMANSGTLNSPLWQPPEMLRGEVYDGKSLDVFSFGIILSEIITLWVPYTWGSEEEAHDLMAEPRCLWPLIARILGGERPQLPASRAEMRPALPTSLSSEQAEEVFNRLISVTQACWAAEPIARPSMHHVAAELRELRDKLRGAREVVAREKHTRQQASGSGSAAPGPLQNALNRLLHAGA